MRYVFIVQGEGRGHLTQAISMERLLRSNGHEVAAVLVGKSPARKLPSFFEEAISCPIIGFESFNFVPSSGNRKASVLKTALYNVFNIASYFPSISLISRKLKELKPDVVVNFYEILGTLGYITSGRKAPMICLAHQFLFLHRDFSFPSKGYEGRFALNLFSRMISFRAKKVLAMSFRAMQDDPKRRIKVVPPLLRQQVLALRKADGQNDPSLRNGDYIHGYMLNAGFAEDVLKWHSLHPETPLRFFWDRKEEAPVKEVDSTLSFYYLDDQEFLRQMAGCGAYASTAGFESVCEAMYLGKPLLMVPSHIEQKCNAFDATSGGAAVSSTFFDLDLLLTFAEKDFKADTDFPDWVRSADEVFLKELTSVS